MKTPVLNIAPGKTVDYHGEPCLVLEHRKDGTLMLHLDQMTHAFGSSNNFAASSLRSHLNGPYLRSLTDGNPDEIITRTVDLTALNGSKEYGTCECKVAPLTLDELRKYSGVFYDRFIRGLWVVAEGLIYTMFNKDFHVVPDAPRPYDRYYISIDYGTANPTSMGLWARAGGKWHRIREYYYNMRQRLLS